jgi:hypothetical protein
MRYTDAIKREGESIGRWCRRYVGISRRDERRSQFCFHQCVGQRSNLLAQLFEKVVNKRVGRPTTGIDLSSTSGRVTSWNCGTSSNVPLFSQSRLRATGADIVFVPYKGAAPAITDVLGGQIQIHVSAKSVLLPLIKSEKLRALAVTSTQRPGIVELHVRRPAGDLRMFVAILRARRARELGLNFEATTFERRNPLGMAANGSAFIGCSAITVSMPLPGLRRLKCLNDWLLLRCMSPILARSVSAAPASLRLLSRGQRTQTRTRPFGCP